MVLQTDEYASMQLVATAFEDFITVFFVITSGGSQGRLKIKNDIFKHIYYVVSTLVKGLVLDD